MGNRYGRTDWPGYDCSPAHTVVIRMSSSSSLSRDKEQIALFPCILSPPAMTLRLPEAPLQNEDGIEIPAFR